MLLVNFIIMKKTIVLFLLAISCQKSSNSFNIPFDYNLTVNFKESSIPDGEVFYLKKYLLDNSLKIIDSCKKVNNLLFFKKKIKEPFIGEIHIKFNNNYKLATVSTPMMIVTNDSLHIEWNDWNEKTKIPMKISGGESEFLNMYAFKFIFPYNRQIEVNNEISKFGLLPSKNPNYKYWSNYEILFYEWIVKNSNKYYTLLKLYDNRNSLSNKTLSNCLACLQNNFENTSVYNLLTKYLRDRISSKIGEKFIDIKLIDNKQNEITSKEIFQPQKELYILDFGASWCGYCIVQAREINKNYSKIDTTKIQIISISIDKEVNDWLQYNKKENYKWKTYLLNNKLDNSSVKSLFTVIPAYIILDSDKKILGKYTSLDSIPFLKLNKT